MVNSMKVKLGEVSLIKNARLVSEKKIRQIVVNKLPTPIVSYSTKDGFETDIKLKKNDIIFNSFSLSSSILLNDPIEELYLGINYTLIRINENVLNPHFFFVFFQRDVINNYENGSLLKKISMKELSELIIPSLHFQNDIIRLVKNFTLFEKSHYKLKRLINLVRQRQYSQEIDNYIKDTKIKYFISLKNKSINKIISKEFLDLKKAMSINIFKIVIIISASLLEFYIIDWLGDLSERKNDKEIRFVDAIADLKRLVPAINDNIIAKCNEVRKSRNYIHLFKYTKESKSFKKDEADDAIKILKELVNVRKEYRNMVG
jgi:hypothetical protein